MAIYLYAGDQIIENVTMGFFYYQDSLGNTSHVTDSAGNLLERYTYSAFGTPYFYNAAGTQIASSTYGIRHLFQGQLWTQETGLNDYRNRAELPTMGVFLQPDPIGFKGDALNTYRFCNNNAVNRVDPLGLEDSPRPVYHPLTSRGGGDWDWFNGRVAAEMMADRNPTVTGKQVTEAARAPTPRRAGSASSKSMRMVPARDPKDPTRYLADDHRYYKNYYHQLTNSAGKAEPGYDNYVQEQTTVEVNECTGCAGGKFRVETTDGQPLRELPRSGLFNDRVGVGSQPSGRVSGTLILDQRFLFQHKDEQPVLLPGVIRHVTTVTNGQSTNNIEP